MSVPLAVFSIFSLFFFRFHFHGLKSFPMAANLDLRSAGGVATTEVLLLPMELDFTSPFFFLSESKFGVLLNNAQTNVKCRNLDI